MTLSQKHYKPWELLYYSILRSCGILSINSSNHRNSSSINSSMNNSYSINGSNGGSYCHCQYRKQSTIVHISGGSGALLQNRDSSLTCMVRAMCKQLTSSVKGNGWFLIMNFMSFPQRFEE